MTELMYNINVQGNRPASSGLGDFCQLLFNGTASLWRSPVTNLASGFPEQKLAKGVAGLFFVPQKEMANRGYIYLIRDRETGYIKIGFSGQPYRRLRELTYQSTLLPRPHNFEIMDAFKGTLQEERRLHHVFSQYRVRGEWFRLCFWRYMDIVYAFDCRERLQGIEWERCDDHIKPFECLDGIDDSCICPECSPDAWPDGKYMGPRKLHSAIV